MCAHHAKCAMCMTKKTRTQIMYTRCQVQTLAEAISFDLLTFSFIWSVTKSLTSSMAELIVSVVNIMIIIAPMIMYSSAIKPKMMPKTTPTTISSGIRRCTVLDSLNIINSPRLESQILRQICLNTFRLSGFWNIKELTPLISTRLGQITPHNIIIPQAVQKVNASELKTSNLKDVILD